MSAAVEEEEEDMQLRLWAERQRAASVAIGGSGLAAARFRDEPEAPGTPPLQVTELGLTCGPEAEPAQCSSEPLCDWFVCDDEATNIRYFAIQGSITLQHWQINLQFDPVVFEDPTYGVRVHRGVYEGHSLGGSLSTLLTLLLLHRGVAHPQQVAPAYAFGAPAVFCGGEDESAFLQQPQQQQQQQQCREEGNEKAIRVQEQAPAPAAPAVSASAPAVDASAPAVDASVPAVHASAHASMPAQDVDAEAIRNTRSSLGLLQRLGLTDRHFVNIIMHRDIVPRAFGCDYALVADLLKQWLPSFKTHPPLQGAYKSLYNFLGSVAVLKPHKSSPFVQPADAGHPLLPELPGLFHLRAPSATDTSNQCATETWMQRGEEDGPQASPAAHTSSTPAATLPAAAPPCNSHAIPEITANHTAVQHVSMPAAAAALPSTLSSHTSPAVPEGTASHSAALRGQAPAASATPPETLPPSVSSSSDLKAAATTGLGERSTLSVHGSLSFEGAESQTGSAACKGADTQIDSAVCKGANAQIGPSAADEQLKHAHIHLVGASSPQNQQGVSGTGSEGFECANKFDGLEASNNDGHPYSPTSHSLHPSLPHRTPQASQAYTPRSTATTAAHHTTILTFPPTSASTARAAAAAVAAAVHAHPAEANMGPGSLQDQAAVAAAAVAAAAAATAFSGDNLAPCSHPGHLRPTTGKSSSSSPLYTSESKRPSHRGSSSDNLALRHPGHHGPTKGKSSSSSPLYTSESRRPPHPERSTFNLALRHPGLRGPTIGAPSSSPSHTNASPHLHDASSSPHLHTSEPRRPSHHGSGSEPNVVVPLQQPSTQQQQQQQQQQLQHKVVQLQQSTQQQQQQLQQQQQQPNDMPHSNDILAAGRVRQPLVLREHQRDSCTVVLGVSASSAQRRDTSGSNSGSVAALQVPSACAAAAAGSSGGGVGHSSSLSSSRGSLEGSSIGADGNPASQGPEDSFSHGSVGSEHGGEAVGSQGRQNQWESAGDERGGRPSPAHRQLSPAVMTLQEATQLFLNTPHPLATLSEYASYGSDGAISRYHNPDNYTKGLIILADLACQSS
ncbi:hypothetical protein DUNSADRAFT_16742 [Dunaliella salina]|uniref:Fungal lipase-type domain-containing protein n=1 Tax=Dunaliella salina TaxID=3046 RepID=A0ABQ7G2Z7_DUNSA|nr:hypothetical protein DUNSADRAFT_16742 [Dunaliella salina]|eukprot:KAF5828980.1 hypothetical protein DUNSADRAFT_16742 [Dunaliella salina]